MQDLDEFTVTDAALAQMANTSDPRLKQLMDAAVRHLHAFAREVNLTPAEWLHGIQFLTAVGQALLGHKPGEHIDLPTEHGTEKVEIVSIEAYRTAAATA